VDENRENKSKCLYKIRLKLIIKIEIWWDSVDNNEDLGVSRKIKQVLMILLMKKEIKV
jgi:hypothetical protein